MPSASAAAPLLRLHPGPVEPTTVADAYLVPRPAASARPWLAVCMIATIDGATARAGRSGGLGNATDRAVLAAMREAADVVLVGSTTARGEGYGPPRKAGLRIGVVTNRGTVDPTAALFTSGAGFVIAPEQAEVPDGVPVLRTGHTQVDLAEAVARLPEVVPGAAFVSAEGGPRLNAGLLAAGLVDELTVTTAPLAIGGPSARLVDGAPEAPHRFELAHLLLDAEDYLFARWVREQR